VTWSLSEIVYRGQRHPPEDIGYAIGCLFARLPIGYFIILLFSNVKTGVVAGHLRLQVISRRSASALVPRCDVFKKNVQIHSFFPYSAFNAFATGDLSLITKWLVTKIKNSGSDIWRMCIWWRINELIIGIFFGKAFTEDYCGCEKYSIMIT